MSSFNEGPIKELFEAGADAEKDATADPCPICFQDMELSDHKTEDVIKTECQHKFHRLCLLEWLNASVSRCVPNRFCLCPMCLRPVSKHYIVNATGNGEIDRNIPVEPKNQNPIWMPDPYDHFWSGLTYYTSMCGLALLFWLWVQGVILLFCHE